MIIGTSLLKKLKIDSLPLISFYSTEKKTKNLLFIIYLQLPEILRSIVLLQIENEMPCFDCENVIFITNKWDTIYEVDSDSSEEDEETKTWNGLISEIKEKWPFVKEENIFKMNLKDVHVCIFLTLFPFQQILRLISMIIQWFHQRGFAAILHI